MRRLALVPLGCLVLLAGCGEEPDPPPPVFEVEAPEGRKTTEFRRAGMTLVRPANWRLRRRDAPGVFELLSGEALVSGWAYPRDEPLPQTAEELDAAKDRLLEAIDDRDRDFEVTSAETTEVAGSPAIDVRGEQVIAKRRLATRSVHVFAGEVEYVIEAIAPPEDHGLVNRQVLAPLLRSLEVEGEVATGGS